jgi:hypothetical protein
MLFHETAFLPHRNNYKNRSSSSALTRLVFRSYADADADGQQFSTANLYQVPDANADIADHDRGSCAI